MLVLTMPGFCNHPGCMKERIGQWGWRPTGWPGLSSPLLLSAPLSSPDKAAPLLKKSFLGIYNTGLDAQQELGRGVWDRERGGGEESRLEERWMA